MGDATGKVEAGKDASPKYECLYSNWILK